MDATEPIRLNYNCERCSGPLKIHSSFGSLSESQLQVLSQKHPQASNVDLEPRDQRLNDSGSNGNGFLLVNESLVEPPPSPSAGMAIHLKLTSRLFDILSDQSTVDHPLCEECADFVIDQMDSQLRVLEEECKEYRELLDTLERTKSRSSVEESERHLEELRKRISEMKAEETGLIHELDEIEKEQEAVNEEMKEQEVRLKRLDEEEDRYWLEYNNLKKVSPLYFKLHELN